MKLKTLLLGSAAAMIAVSGARAADAVVAEPEPMEYVKVCDTYGSGFHYIPGTETCMNINGYARVEYIYTDTDGAGSAGDWRYRARLNFDVRNETDYGTLRSQIRIQGDGQGGADANAVIDRALISLGGLTFGYSDDFFTTNHGYGWQKAANDGFYSYDQAIMLQYTYSANGFSGTIGLQDGAGGVAGSENPDWYVGLSYGGSWGRVAGTVISDNLNGDDLAWKVSADINVIEGFGIHGWYAADGGNTDYVTGYTSNTVENEWGVDVNYQVNSDLNVWVGYTAFDGGALAAATNSEGYNIGVGAIWNPVPGLSVRPEVIFGEFTSGVVPVDTEFTQYRLRVVRSF